MRGGGNLECANYLRCAPLRFGCGEGYSATQTRRRVFPLSTSLRSCRFVNALDSVSRDRNRPRGELASKGSCLCNAILVSVPYKSSLNLRRGTIAVPERHTQPHFATK